MYSENILEGAIYDKIVKTNTNTFNHIFYCKCIKKNCTTVQGGNNSIINNFLVMDKFINYSSLAIS